VSAVPELTAGTLRTVTLSAPEQLGGVFKGGPTLIESGVDCKVGMWRGLIAAPGIAAGETVVLGADAGGGHRHRGMARRACEEITGPIRSCPAGASARFSMRN